MKQPKILLLVFSALLTGTLPCAAGDANEKIKPEKVKSIAGQAAENTPSAAIEIPESVFTIPATPREGRNPFFPVSMTEAPPAPKATTPNEPEGPAIVLNGISSPPKRTAMLNGVTFEKGEVGEVKLRNGERVALQCVDIRDNSVIVVVGTERMELRLRTGI